MNETQASREDLKEQAALRAVAEVTSNMVVGLGTGSTAVHAVRALGQRLADGRLVNIVGIPTSTTTAREARTAGIPLGDLADYPVVDLTIDGADEVDPRLDLIKGLGGALLREKVVAAASRRNIVVVDDAKLVARLGERAPVPVEVIPFARAPVEAYLRSLALRPVLRLDAAGQTFVTDEGNHILDAHAGPIADPVWLADALRQRPGVVEHGLFLGLATQVVVASAEGVRLLERA